jgi:hypothetical protein
VLIVYCICIVFAKVDDGLPLRKAALTCCETILFVAPDSMDATGLMAKLMTITADNKEDTNMQCHQVGIL